MRRISLSLVISAFTLAGACAPASAPTLTVYSGRGEDLVRPVIESFEAKTGITVEVRYGGSAQLAATILEESASSPADVYYGQDAGALGALAKAKRLRELPQTVLDKVDARFRGRDGRWVASSGRARVLAYNTNALRDDELPDSVNELTDPKWRGRVGWAPTNGSFQAFVTAMRFTEGDEATREWLVGMVNNETKAYRDNTPLFDAVARGEVDVGLTNHYYLVRFIEERGEDVSARNYSPRAGGAGALVNIAGAGILDNAPNADAALQFIEHLLSNEAQSYFAEKTYEYPLVRGIPTHELIPPLSEIRTPDIDLGELDDLEGTLAMLQEVGAL